MNPGGRGATLHHGSAPWTAPHPARILHGALQQNEAMTRRHPPPSPSTPAPAPAGRTLRILLVRDPLDANPLNVETIRNGLVSAGFSEIQIVDADLHLPDVITATQPDMLIIASESAARDTMLRTHAATFDSLFESIAVFAPDGRMQVWNRRFAQDWGLDAAFLDTHPRIDALLERIGARLKRTPQARLVGDVIKAATLERKQKRGRANLADGRTLEFAGVPLPDGNGLLTVLDISDSQKAEAALLERNAALVEADALKTRFLANMSYEFRTPLTSIGGFAELLQAGLGGELSEAGKEYAEAILASVGKTGRAVIVQEAPRVAGFGAEIAAVIAEKAILDLRAPVLRVTGYDVPFPYWSIEHEYLPSAGRVAAAATTVLGY